MTCYRLRLFFLGFMLCSLLVVTGCDAEQTERNAHHAQQGVDALGGIVPSKYMPYLAITTSVLSVVAGIAGVVRERKKANLMKSAILTKADQIDKLALSAAAATENPGNIVTKFMKTDTRTRTPAEKKALHMFDAVRKGYVL